MSVHTYVASTYPRYSWLIALDLWTFVLPSYSTIITGLCCILFIWLSCTYLAQDAGKPARKYLDNIFTSYLLHYLLKPSAVSPSFSSKKRDNEVSESSSKPSSKSSQPKGPIPPCAEVISRAEKANLENAHENEGFLSYDSGFLPLHQPLQSFPESHSAWDEVTRRMPDLIKGQTLQETVRNMPVLPADSENLPDAYLHRAATFFCITAHAYIRLDGEAPLELVGAGGERRIHRVPESLEKPWTEVSKRLGRPLPFMSYIDLIVYNWRWPSTDSALNRNTMKMEDLELLVPTVGNQEERVFYLTQLEILSRATPLLQSIVKSHRAVLQGDTSMLTSELKHMITTLKGIRQGTLAKVSSRPSSTTYTDPVVWTKSVASLAIPLRSDVTGPTGTGSPFFHMMDEFVERPQHNGHLGQEYMLLRAGYPAHWRALLEAIKEVSIQSYVKGIDDDELSGLWSSLKDEYYGQFGLLGIHRRKVFAYLSTSFRIGRTTTIGGFNGKPSEEPWVKVHRELNIARRERFGGSPESNDDSDLGPRTAKSPPAAALRRIPVSEVLSHTTKADGYWFSAKGKVYDATSYCAIHPGGDKIIAISSGRDITADLGMVQHLSDPAIRAKLERYAIGQLDVCSFAETGAVGTAGSQLQKLYDFAIALGYRAADCQNTWALDMTFLRSKLTRVDPVSPSLATTSTTLTLDAPATATAPAPSGEPLLTMQKGRYFERSCASLRTVYAPSLAAHVAAVIDVVAETFPEEKFTSTLDGLRARTESVKEGRFVAAAAPATMGTLDFDTAESMARHTLGRLTAARQSAVALLRALEGMAAAAAAAAGQSGPGQQTLQQILSALDGLMSVVETLGSQ